MQMSTGFVYMIQMNGCSLVQRFCGIDGVVRTRYYRCGDEICEGDTVVVPTPMKHTLAINSVLSQRPDSERDGAGTRDSGPCQRNRIRKRKKRGLEQLLFSCCFIRPEPLRARGLHYGHILGRDTEPCRSQCLSGPCRWWHRIYARNSVQALWKYGACLCHL